MYDYIVGVRIPSAHTDVSMVQFTTTMAYGNLNKQTSTILTQKFVVVLSFEGKIPRAVKRFVCKLLRFLLRRRFCPQNWYYAQLYTSSISRYFL